MRYADTYLIICLLTDQDMEDRAEMAVSCRTTSLGPDLQNIIRQSYDKVMTMTEVMTNHTTDAIYKKIIRQSYDKLVTQLTTKL